MVPHSLHFELLDIQLDPAGSALEWRYLSLCHIPSYLHDSGGWSSVFALMEQCPF